jgi:hypothetical protein
MEQFQLEADIRTSRTLTAARTAHTTHEENSLQPRILSLLLGLTMRDWLCDYDKEFLDSLVEDPELIFLLKGGICLHPEGAPFIPIEQIESSHRLAGGAVFTQRHTVDRGQERLTIKIKSGSLGSVNGSEMLLGVLGGSHREDRDSATRFDHLLAAFRRARVSLESLTEAISRITPVPLPALFVNRSSGRILGLTPQASELFGNEANDIVGMEFGAARKNLGNVLAEKTLKIKNLRHDGLELAIVIVLSEPEAKVSPASLPPTIGFIQTVRNNVATIAAAAQHLDSILGRNPGSSVGELIQIIREEAADLDRHAWRQELIAEYPNLPKVEAKPVAELKAAIDLVSAFRNKCRIMLFEDAIDGCRISCPRSSMLLLFESILRSHLTANHDQIESRITVRYNKNTGELAVLFETKHHSESGGLAFHPDWLDYLYRLAAVMEIEVSQSTDSASNCLQTQVCMK